ncbi:DUF4176 domain-containing protein [Enterococcus faecalis]|uniref:DUF4176 domain-containing protein n=1 Tax=Enterococcus faecalis TaxID=1351 RepID=UPI003CC6CE68
MRVKKLFNVTFEQSLNLLDDQLVMYMIKDTEKRSLYNGEKRYLLFALSIIFILIQYGLVLLTQYIINNPDSDSFVPKADINFLSKPIFWLFFGSYIVCWIYMKLKNDGNESVAVFVTMCSVNNFTLWLIVEINLMFITAFLKPLTVLGTIVLLIGVFIVGVVILKKKITFLNVSLLDMRKNKNTIDPFIEKTLQIILKYAWIVIIVWAGWKIFFPSNGTPRTDVVGFIGMAGMWVILDIGFIAAEAYLFFPYLLHGYYKYKYPEKYRKWEGKTQLEWYGEKYFNKHIKGTKKEECGND